MKSKGLTRTVCLLMAGMVGVGGLIAAPPAPSPAICACDDVDYQAKASELLKEVRSSASKLARDAEVLGIYSRGSISREGHTAQINLVKDHINAIGDRLNQLRSMREEIAPWQRNAMDSLRPMTANLAAQTTAAIQHLNDSGRPLWAPQYTDLLRTISERSTRMSDAVDLHLEMAGAQDKLDRLRDRVETLGS